MTVYLGLCSESVPTDRGMSTLLGLSPRGVVREWKQLAPLDSALTVALRQNRSQNGVWDSWRNEADLRPGPEYKSQSEHSQVRIFISTMLLWHLSNPLLLTDLLDEKNMK